jgi:hypothetical protein
MAAAWRTSPVLLCLVGIGLATGAAATLLASPTRPVGTEVIIDAPYHLSNTAIGILFLLPFATGFGAILYRRVTSGAQKLPLGIIALGIAALVVMGALVVVTHFVNPSTNPLPGGSGTKNSTGGGGGKSNSTGGNASTHGTPFVGLNVPSWTPFVVVSVLALALVGILLPATWAAIRRGRAPPKAPASETVAARSNAREALAGAAADLNAGGDPRAVIERLYLRLLDRVAVVAGDLDLNTPEEIRGAKLLPLGVRPAAAVALTRLFEEARYSTHPMGPEAAHRARDAVATAAADLARAPVAG